MCGPFFCVPSLLHPLHLHVFFCFFLRIAKHYFFNSARQNYKHTTSVQKPVEPLLKIVDISVHNYQPVTGFQYPRPCSFFFFFPFAVSRWYDNTVLVGFHVTVPNLKVSFFDPRAAVFSLSLKYFILYYCLWLYMMYFFCIRHIMFGCMIFLCFNRRLQNILVKC